MITVVLILASVFAYHLIADAEWRKILLSAISMWVYYTFVEWYAMLVPLMAAITYFTLRWAKATALRYALWVHCSLLVTGLILLKYGLKDFILPVGYSIMAFSSISAVCDGYKNQKSYSFWSILAFISFFPKIMAGPLERIDSMAAQHCSGFSLTEVYIGIKHLIFGLFGKFVIAANIENALMFDNGCIDTLASAISYAVMFYFDFWSYCNISIGVAALYGIRLTQNFRAPYRAMSFRDFWTRWNITLTSWLRDYVYIPLGGSKRGRFRNIFNVYVVFAISALWHGVSIPFLLWGALHACLYSIERYTPMTVWKISLSYRIFVFASVCLLWQMFRLDSAADIAVFARQLAEWQEVHMSTVCMCIGSLMCLMLLDNDKFQHIMLKYPRRNPGIIAEVVSLSLMVMCLILTGDYSVSPFIYFSF